LREQLTGSLFAGPVPPEGDVGHQRKSPRSLSDAGLYSSERRRVFGVVDFAGVQHVSYAFADEFAGKLVVEDDDLAVE
jgi:hypothetical protein